MKNCSFYQKQLLVNLFDELPVDDDQDLQHHLQTCETCRLESLRLRSFIDRLPAAHLDSSWSRYNRQQLFYRLRRKKIGKAESYFWASTLAGRMLRYASFALALVLFFLLGRTSMINSRSLPSVQDLMTADRLIVTEYGEISPHLLDVNKININADGSFEIVYQTLNLVRLQGKADDPVIRQMINNALQAENATVRLHAVKAAQFIIDDQCAMDKKTIESLESILENEKNLGIKLAVMKTFDTFPDSPAIEQILLRSMLTDSSEAVRIQAFKILARRGALTAPSLPMQSTQNNNIYIRTKVQQLLQERDVL
ncbi:MAG: hypothetical protein EHM72_03530 [Calditrichaeota bacterium]|nr:MAG: hypothetical protein EHM72_03530 [Calditrichota bacterium]